MRASLLNGVSSFRKAFVGMLSWVSIVAGAASFFVLIVQGYEFGVAAPLENIVTTYNQIVHAIGELVKPLLLGLLAVLKWLVPAWDLHLAPDWKHILIALGALIGAFARTPEWSAKLVASMMLSFAPIAILAPAGSERLIRPVDSAVLTITVQTGLALLTLGVVLLWLSRFGTGDNAADTRATAFTFMVVPLVAIVFLLANAGLQAVGN